MFLFSNGDKWSYRVWNACNYKQCTHTEQKTHEQKTKTSWLWGKLLLLQIGAKVCLRGCDCEWSEVIVSVVVVGV